MFAIECASQTHKVRPLRQHRLISEAYLVDLALYGTARNGTLGPALGHHSAQPHTRKRKKR